MKFIAACVWLVLAFMTTCCRPVVPDAPLPRAPQAAAAPAPKVLKDLDLVLHVDVDFTADANGGRPYLERAARNIRELTHGRARIRLVYDVEFETENGFKNHVDAHHSMLLAILSDFKMAHMIDENLAETGPGLPLAATIPLWDGAFQVYLILDRIPADHFEAVITHELGHVIGLPDLPEQGAIMSGTEGDSVPTPSGWTQADRDLCRSFDYCD
jgi:hypothetical protein